MTTHIHQRVEAARRGESPTLLCKMASGWAVMGDIQILNGYCLLLSDPVVPDLNALSMPERERFLCDMTIIGDVLLEVFGAARINYEILGNSDNALYAHIVPRYEAESTELGKSPIWFYNWSQAPRFELKTYQPMRDQIRAGIEKRLAAC